MLKYSLIITFVTLVTSAFLPNDYDDLGARISAKVRQDLAPLKNLGAQINAKVQHDLAPWQNLRPRIKADVETGLRPINTMNYHNAFDSGRQFHGFGPDFGSQLASNIQAGLAPLNNLGAQIEHEVQQRLQPVKALALVSGMRVGTGGVTVAKHSPSGKQFIFINGKPYRCDGTVSASGQCDKTLEPFSVRDDTDYCYIRSSYSVFNNYICIGATTVSIINGQISCTNAYNHPVLVMTRDDFNRMCKDLSQKVEYRYIPDPQNPAHIKIPNENKYVRCDNNEPNVCVFSETTLLGGSNIVTTSENHSSYTIIN